MTRADRIRQFWIERAAAGDCGGTRDRMAVELEHRAILAQLPVGARILEAGCGGGDLAALMACTGDVTGFDIAPAAIEDVLRRGIPGTFFVGDITNPPKLDPVFDVVVTKRAITNLPGWTEQEDAIYALCGYLKPGGKYLMCESSQDGLDALNLLRAGVGLPPVVPPWHNRYLRQRDIDALQIPGVRLESVADFSSTYYFLSRVANAWLAAQDGVEPSYGAPINLLAYTTPPVGTVGQTRLWTFTKDGSDGEGTV